MHSYVGQEPSGRFFNEICLDSKSEWERMAFVCGTMIVKQNSHRELKVLKILRKKSHPCLQLLCHDFFSLDLKVDKNLQKIKFYSIPLVIKLPNHCRQATQSYGKLGCNHRHGSYKEHHEHGRSLRPRKLPFYFGLFIYLRHKQ